MLHGNQSSEFKRNLYGWFGDACRQEIFGGNLCLDVADARNQSSDLNGFRRIFLVAMLEILEEILIKYGRRPEIILLPMNQNLKL